MFFSNKRLQSTAIEKHNGNKFYKNFLIGSTCKEYEIAFEKRKKNYTCTQTLKFIGKKRKTKNVRVNKINLALNNKKEEEERMKFCGDADILYTCVRKNSTTA